MRNLKQQMLWYGRAQWVMGAALLGGMLLFYMMGDRPLEARLEALKFQIESKKRDLTESQNRARSLPLLAFECRQLESQVNIYERQFPHQMDLGPFIRDLTQVSQELALRDWKYRPALPVKRDVYFELPVHMQFEGDFSSVALFMRQVEELPRLTRVKSLNIENKDPKTGTVAVELALNIYFSEG
jgi:Tfp pilus assembly protein PilO